MKTIAVLLRRAGTLKRFGTSSAVEKQIAKIIAHPDLEHLCSLLEAVQNLSFVSKAAEVEDEEELFPEDELNEQDIVDLDADIIFDDDEESNEDNSPIEDSIEDSELMDDIIDEVEGDYDDLEIIIDDNDEDNKDDEYTKDSEALSRLVKAKLAAKNPAKILITKASILAKKKALNY